MTAVTDLQTMLQSMQPELLEESFVFLVFADAQYGDHIALRPFAAVQEKEGLTLIVTRTAADEAGLQYGDLFRCISLNLHSALEVAGLVAAFSSALAAAGISANVIAGFYHDHIFVPAARAEEALAVLQDLSARADV